MSKRIIWTLLFLGVCIGWLVLSYRPGLLTGHEVVFGLGIEPYFRWLVAGSALLFVVIQFVLLVGVRTFPDHVPRDEKLPNESDIRIWPAAEFFWTALPLLMSLVLFWAVWQLLPN